MKRLTFAMLLFSVAAPISTPIKSQPRALIFSKTTGFRHDSIPDGVAAIRQLGQQNGFDADAIEDAAAFSDQNLARYQAVVFLSTTGDILNDNQQAAFERFIRNGGGFAGVHSASDTEYDWPWYGGLVGAYFQSHPAIQRATIRVEDAAHPSTAALPANWERSDEWYNFRLNPRGRVKTLARLDEATYQGGGMGADHPIAWCQLYDGGRAWYTAGGHTRESYAEPLFRQHLLGGLQFALGLRDGACAALSATSAASFRAEVVAADSIVSIFGAAMATTTQAAVTTPLPTALAGASVRFKDSAGAEGLAPLFFVSPTQINLLVPADAAAGAATFTVLKSDGTAPGGRTEIAPVAPALFAANANGQGVATGVALRVRAGVRAFLPIAQFDAVQNRFVAAPIDLSVPTDDVFLVLFGAGFRAQRTARIQIGGMDLPVSFAGAQGTLAGLDQVNVALPRSLAGRGEVDVVLTVDGKTTNTVRVNFN